MIRKALAAGKHVLSEKPVAPDVAQGRALIAEYEATYKPKGLVWRVAENFEAEPAYQAASRIVREGKIGEVKYFNARAYSWVDEHSKWYNTPWRTVPDVRTTFASTCSSVPIVLRSRVYCLTNVFVLLTWDVICTPILFLTVPRRFPGAYHDDNASAPCLTRLFRISSGAPRSLLDTA